MLYAILGTSRMEEAMVKAIVGANWGDEGKGKITDMLAEESDIVVRFQGGSNAGHTIINDYGKFALHLLPSGVFYNHITSVIGNGVALNIPYLVKELKSLTDRNVPMPKILVSDRAQIMMPYHIDFDTYEEARLAGKSFGSTKSGIAPFYSDKYAKIGFQVSELFGDENALKEKIANVCTLKNVMLEHLYHQPLLNEEDIFNSIVTNKKFMYSSLRGFSNYDCMGFFDELGLKFKIERGNRVFPESDHSSDVIGALSRQMKKLGVNVLLNTQVVVVNEENGEFAGVVVKDASGQKEIKGDACVIATGGNSYSSTGSTGDGYRFAKSLGHSVTSILPALVPLNVREEWEELLMGLSLKNIEVAFYDGDRKVFTDFGEMLFTHFGVSGPVILSASSVITGIVKERPVRLSIDLKPAITDEQLDERILRDFSKEQNKAFKNSLDELLPKKLIPVIVMQSGIKPEKKVNEVTREERQRLVKLLKNFEMTITSTRGFNEAIITQGGVNVKEINPSTMESKLVKNIYFAGEVIDVDAVTGGFNLQVAWSTAYAAASHIQ